MRVKFIFSSRHTKTIDPNNAHRKKVPEIVGEVIRISDIVLEVLDARFIDKTRNIEIENSIREQNKLLIYVINKVDLVDRAKIKEEIELKELKPYVIFSCKQKQGIKNLRERIKIEVKRLKIDETKGFRRAQVGIVGYPNVGKSSIINILGGRKKSGTSSQAGFTRGMQKIRINKGILLIDTPGVIPDKESTKGKTAYTRKHTEIGIKGWDKVQNPDFIVHNLMQKYPKTFEKYYKVDAEGDAEILLEEIGKRSHFLKKGNQIDIDRTARLVLKEWQEGKIRIK